MSAQQPHTGNSTPDFLRRHPHAVIFLTLYIDLAGFSLLFPLFPDLYNHYIAAPGNSPLLSSLIHSLNNLAQHIGASQQLPLVLFGGLVASLYSTLQFIFAPFWGALSDKYGRRPILLTTVAGTAIAYLLWTFSSTLSLFILSRLIAGAFAGNLSVATAAIADTTTPANRSRTMGLVGAAFGLGLLTGPLLGSLSAQINLSSLHPALNPFSAPALLSLALSLINLLWLSLLFPETLPSTTNNNSPQPRHLHLLRHRIRDILSLSNPAIRLINLVSFLHSSAFVAMETTLVFLSSTRFHYTARQNGMLLCYLGLCSILTQGLIIRRLLNKLNEVTLLRIGLVAGAAGLALTGTSTNTPLLYLGITLIAFGSGLVTPSCTGLISLNTSPDQQGQNLGTFKSLGALSRAIIPIISGIIFWTSGPKFLFLTASTIALVAWLFTRRLHSIKTLSNK